MSAPHGTKIALAILLCSILSACGGPQIDSRNVDWNNGLAYEHGSTEPYTGTLVFKDSIPNNLDQYWSANVSAGGDEAAENVLTGCTEHFTKGVVDGDAACKGQGGDTALTLTFKNERYDGVSEIYNPHTGDLFKKLHWNEGLLDGEVETYYYETGKKHSDAYYKAGTQDGRTRVWDKDGEVLTDAEFENGNPVDGQVTTQSGTLNYKDGKLDGPAVLRWSGRSDYRSKGQYSAGVRVGTWEDKGGDAEVLYDEQIQKVLWSAIGLLADEDALRLPIDRTVSNWTDGHLDGKAEGFDQSGDLVFTANFKDGKLDGEYSSHPNAQYQSRLPLLLVFQNGELAGCVGERKKETHSSAVRADELTAWQSQCQLGAQTSATPTGRAMQPTAAPVVASTTGVPQGPSGENATVQEPAHPVVSPSSSVANTAAQSAVVNTPALPPNQEDAGVKTSGNEPIAPSDAEAAAPTLAPNTVRASFDCAKAGTQVEKMICSNQVLADEDVQLTRLYKAALSASVHVSELKLKQRAWVAERNACATPECVNAAYQKRIAELGAAR